MSPHTIADASLRTLPRVPTPAETPTARTNPLWGDDWPEVRAWWPLTPTALHLNHGSYGAVPTPVVDEQRSWRERMEENPVRFFDRELPVALEDARHEVARFLGADDDGIAFVANATTAANTVLASFPLRPGDQVLVTDHGYGAVNLAAQRRCERSGAQLAVVHVPLCASDEEAAAAVLDAVTDATVLAVLDEITSPTARTLPLARLVPALRSRGVATLIDGAHAPGMLPVDLAALGADYWTGNLHKWGCTPRGTAALWAAPSRRAGLRPLVVSWEDGRGFPWAFNCQGTDDFTAWLAAPRALRLLQGLGWERLRAHNVELARHGQRVVAEALGLDASELPVDPQVSMQLVPLPAGIASTRSEAEALHQRLGEQAGAEVAVTCWNGQGFVRLCAQVYNAPSEYERLAELLPALL
jgi:isopenicillin-N epimerase